MNEENNGYRDLDYYLNRTPEQREADLKQTKERFASVRSIDDWKNMSPDERKKEKKKLEQFFLNDALEKRNKKLAPFQHLWKIDDSEWMNQRKMEWDIIRKYEFNECPKKEQKLYEGYFLYGKYTQDSYIPAKDKWVFCPLDSAKTAYDFFYSSIFDRSAKRTLLLLDEYFPRVPRMEKPLWYREHSKYFIDGILGQEFKELSWNYNQHNYIITGEPGFWASGFITRSIRILNGEGYSPKMDAMDYFISCLPETNQKHWRSVELYNKMWILVEKVLADKSADEYAKEHADNLKVHEQQIADAWAINAHLDITTKEDEIKELTARLKSMEESLIYWQEQLTTFAEGETENEEGELYDDVIEYISDAHEGVAKYKIKLRTLLGNDK